jgi:D-amino-acid dehydrogenase
MKALILGGGIAGLTTAWYLAETGAEVTVIDRGGEPASETSHANGGHISTQSGKPWTGPAAFTEFFRRPIDRNRPVRIRRGGFPQFIPWATRALASAHPARYRRHCETLTRLAAYSRECLDSLISEQALDIALDTRGTYALYRTSRAFERARRHIHQETLGPAEIITQEPALANARIKPAGAIHYSGDATGDCRAFCEQLAARLAARGVHLRWNTEVHHLPQPTGENITLMLANGEAIDSDTCVVANGAEATPLLRRVGMRLPIIPLRGYTLTAPLAAGSEAPGRIADAERHLVFARLGEHFRAAGMADFDGFSREAPAARLAQLERHARDWYPDMGAPEFWACLRPITPDGPPIIGASGIPNVWLHTGLGPLGWTLACGAARIVADRIIGQSPAIDTAGLTLERFS